jgi:hypothetical protein
MNHADGYTQHPGGYVVCGHIYIQPCVLC